MFPPRLLPSIFMKIPLHLSAVTCTGILAVLALQTAHCVAPSEAEGTGLSYSLPSDGHVTLAINDAEGRRVRNLLADDSQQKGKHTAIWDGRDDSGQLVPAGKYSWLGLVRGALDVLYRGTWQAGSPPWSYGKTGGWLSDHYPPCAVACLKDRVLVGAGVCEDGRGITCVTSEGSVIWTERWLAGLAWNGAASLKTDGERVFAMGFPNWIPDFHTVVEVNPGTGAMWPVVRIPNTNPPKDGSPTSPTGQIQQDERTKGVGGLRVVGARRTGGTRWDGELFVSDVLGEQPRTFVYSTGRAPGANDETGYFSGGDNKRYTMSLLRVLPLKIWDMAWLPDGRCLAVLDRSVVVLDPQTGGTTPLISSGLEAPFAIATDAKGRIFVSDRGGREQQPPKPKCYLPLLGLRVSDRSSQQVKIFDASGKLLRAMGREGGRRFGAIDPRDFYFPAGLGVDADGRLWVTEEFYPKRVSLWQIPDQPAQEEPKLVKEFFSASEYGEGGYMPDPKNPGQIISEGRGVLWDVDIAKGTFHPLQLLPRINGPEQFGSMSYDPDFPFPLASWAAEANAGTNVVSFENKRTLGGRTFAWSGTPGETVAVIGEQSERAFKPLAGMGTVSNYMNLTGQYGENWVPRAIMDAAKNHPRWAELAKRQGLDPAMADMPHDPKLLEKWPKELAAFNWTDANGDGKMQSSEIVFSPLMSQHGMRVVTFDAQLDALVAVTGNLWKVKCEGFSDCGAPRYDWSKALPMQDKQVGIPSYVGSKGEMLVTPGYTSLAPLDISYIAADGKLRWSYPTFAPSHSHRGVPNIKEKILVPGTIYGAWNMQGVVTAPNDPAHLFLLHGGHGMDYLMTLEDGLFVGTLFKPGYGFPGIKDIAEAKPGMALNEFSLQDECFNGSFVRVEKSGAGFEAGHYYLLGKGCSGVFEVTGLDSVKRLAGGTITRTEAPVADARNAERKADMQQWEKKLAGTSYDIACSPTPTGFDTRRIAFNSRNPKDDLWAVLWHNPKGLGIGIRFGVAHGGALANVFSSDAPSWDQIILHGDAVEVDIAGEPANEGCAPGDPRRLVFAHWQGQPIAVLYRKVKPDAIPAEAVALQNKASADGSVWIAERLAVPINDFKVTDSPYYNTSASFLCLVPWETLGLVQTENLKLRVNIIQTQRKVAGSGLRRAAWVPDGTNAIADMASALDRPASLWRPCTLRAKDYVFPPPVPEQDGGIAGKEEFVVAAPGSPLNKPAQFAGATVWLSSTPAALEMKWYVTKDSSPFVNNGSDWTLLFKTGDVCDFQLESPTLGRCRYLISMFEGKPTVVRFRYAAKDAPAEQGIWYRSPIGEIFVPVVERMDLVPEVERGDSWYVVKLAIPWKSLGIDLHSPIKPKFELGLLRSDASGTKTISRDYWHSGLSGMVQDVPSEARPTEQLGTLRIQP